MFAKIADINGNQKDSSVYDLGLQTENDPDIERLFD